MAVSVVCAHCSVLDREDAILSLTPFEGSSPVVVELVDLSFEESNQIEGRGFVTPL